MKQYLNALKHILENGETREDRTGTGTIGVFGHQARYNLRETFPAVTTKKLAWKSVVSELLWFLEGSDDEKTRKQSGLLTQTHKARHLDTRTTMTLKS